jgi:hypothetical protein
MFIATYIHNQSLGPVYLFNDFQDALNRVIEIAEGILDRDLTEEESFAIENEGELEIDQDHDNQYTVTLGATE